MFVCEGVCVIPQLPLFAETKLRRLIGFFPATETTRRYLP
jgi:hypothetical protein